MSIKGRHLVEKRNILNEIRSNNMSLNELRFFSIYLAKINARDASTRLVTFKLSDFQRILGYDDLNLAQLRGAIDSLLCRIVEVPMEEEGWYSRFQLFKKASFGKDKNGEWCVEIDAHDDALPLMFEFKERYFTYELWIALRLRSSNQFRMYEILKQYERLGERIIDVVQLREWLGIESFEYPRFGNFKVWVLDACQRALAENTDIKFTYQPTGKRGKGGKINYLKFTIQHNEAYIDQLSLEDFINKPDVESILTYNENIQTEVEVEDNIFERELYPFFSEACRGEFSVEEMQVLYNMIIAIIPFSGNVERYKLAVYDYLKRKHDELRLRVKREDLSAITSRFSYIRKTIEADATARRE